MAMNPESVASPKRRLLLSSDGLLPCWTADSLLSDLSISQERL